MSSTYNSCMSLKVRGIKITPRAEREREREREMSLVDYASSSSSSADDEDDEDHKHDEESRDLKHEDSTPGTLLHSKHQSVSSSSQYYGGHSQSSSSTIEKLPDASLLLNLHSSLNSTMKLPDASLLLNSPTLPSHQVSGNNHSSRVEAAIEKNERKRELNASASSLPHGKLPKGNLPHLKNTSSSVVGLLVPPQLSGRSNVVTEDISKLFVKRAANQSSH